MKKFLAIIFILLLILPTAARILDLDFEININRLGLKFPQPYGRALLETEYYRAFDQYFDDSFPIRSPLILAKNWIDFSIFRTTEAADVHIGRQGWLYSRKSIADCHRADGERATHIERLMLGLHAIEKIVAASGRQFLFVVAPHKAAVYPEFIGLPPDFINSGCSQYDILLDLLDRYPMKGFVRLDNVITAAQKSGALLYDRTHAYWNGLGASVAAEGIQRQIHGSMTGPFILDYISTIDDRIGDLRARILGFAPQRAEFPYQRLTGSGQPGLPSGILYGDAFRYNLTPYLLQMFKRLDIIQADRIPSIQHREDWHDYDYILLEIAQTGLPSLNIDLDKIYGMLAARSQILRRRPLDPQKAVPVSKISLHQLSEGLEIKSLGAGSAFELAGVPASNREIFRVLKLSFAARQSDRMRIQYRSPLRNAMVKSIKKGNTGIYLPLPFQETVAVRIYPGDKAGLTVLRFAEIIEFYEDPNPGTRSLTEMTAVHKSVEGLKSDTTLVKSSVAIEGDESGKRHNSHIFDLSAEYNLAAVKPDILNQAKLFPDDDLMAEAEPEISSKPNDPDITAATLETRSGVSFEPGSPPDLKRKVEAVSEFAGEPAVPNHHLLIVDARIELSQTLEDLSNHHEIAATEPDIAATAEIMLDDYLAEEAASGFPKETEILSDHELIAATKSMSSTESAVLPTFDRSVQREPEILGKPEVIHDQEPELLTESFNTRDHELVAETYSEMTDATPIPPMHDPVSENPNLPNSHQQQDSTTIVNTLASGHSSTDVKPLAETEVAVTTSPPDHGATQAADIKDRNDDDSMVLAKVEKAAADPPSINLTDIEDGRIFQRRNGRADIVVSGTFTGSAKTIEARVVGVENQEEIVPWTVIDDSPQNGIFVGMLSGVPQGGWYHLQVRLGQAPSVSDKGSHKWGVGILIACLGQSNMKEWFHSGESFKAHSLIRIYSESGWTEPGIKGNGALGFGNRLAQSLGFPVGLLNYAVNGSGLRKEADWGTGYWEDISPGSIYSRFIAGVSRIGGTLEFVIWFQGEADAARKTVTESEYRDSLTSFISNQIRSDMTNGSNREHLPFLIIMLTRRPGGHDEPHQAIRNAQKRVAEDVADCYLAATTLDLKNRGKQHMHPKAYTTMGHRVAQTVLFILGKAPYYRGPTAITARQIDDRRIDVSIKHRGGGDFKPARGISGWEILVNEESRSIAEVKRQDSSTIRIILEDPLTDTATVRYLYGAMPDARNPIFDNSTLSLPLEPYQARVQ